MSKRIEFQSTVGDGYAIPRADESPIGAVARSLARRTNSTVGPVRLDSWAENGGFARYEVALLDRPMRGGGDAVPFRDVWVTVYR
jgi:hypothetical protein